VNLKTSTIGPTIQLHKLEPRHKKMAKKLQKLYI